MATMMSRKPSRSSADADRYARRAGCVDDRLNPVARADVARIDAHLGNPGGNGFKGALVMQLDVSNDRHAGFLNKVWQNR